MVTREYVETLVNDVVDRGFTKDFNVDCLRDILMDVWFEGKASEGLPCPYSSDTFYE